MQVSDPRKACLQDVPIVHGTPWNDVTQTSTKTHKQGHVRRTTSTNVFLSGDTVEPDTVSQQLEQAGDVESNPGPVPTCKTCRKPFAARDISTTCQECGNWFHKSHTGDTRWHMEKLEEKGEEYTCRPCRGVKSVSKNTNVDPSGSEAITSGKCAAKSRTKCSGIIKKGQDFFRCVGCKSDFHKKCSDMTREQQLVVDRSRWKCRRCQEEEAIPKPPDDQDQSEDITYVTKNTEDRILKIIQWNADGILSGIEEFKHFINGKEVDIFALQETKLRKQDSIKVPGYTIVRQDRKMEEGSVTRGGGVLIGIKKDIGFNRVKTNIIDPEDKITESITIEIPTDKKGKLRISSIYSPPVKSTIENPKIDTFNPDKWPCKEFDMILTDSNAHSIMWDNSDDTRGKTLEEWIAKNNMACINTGQPTHTNRSTKNEGAPDTTIVHSSMLDKVSWEVLNELNSDHYPIMLEYGNSFPKVNAKVRYKWKIQQADWSSYTEQIEKSIPCKANYNNRKATKLEKTLRKKILSAARTHIGTKKVSNTAKGWMTPEIKEAISKRNKLRKTRGSNREAWIQAGHEVAEMIRQKRQDMWKEYVEGLDPKDNPAQVWKTIRSMDGRHPEDRANEALVVDGKAYVEDKDKAERFAETYKSFSKIPIGKKDQKFRKTVRLTMKEKTKDENEKRIKMEELDRVINNTKSNKAAGDDMVPYEFLKHLGPKAKEMLLCIYNKCWSGHDLPPQWLKATIRPLLKPGKDPKETKSYRPISLTSCMGKIMEKIIADRLTYILEDRKLINDNQAGFRQNRCTTDQVLKLTQDAIDQIHDRGCNFTTVAFFDYEKAYDKVWREGLLHKIQELGIPQKFQRYIRQFLSSRKATVDINGENSRVFKLDQGLPQGSAISPILFLIFINDIGVDLEEDTMSSLFADDTSVYRQAKVDDTIGKKNPNKEERTEIRKENETSMQRAVNTITRWAKKWKMSINAGKTKAMIFTTSPEDKEWKPDLKADDVPIEIVPTYKFLGVTADRDLRFLEHVDTIVAKCRKRINILRCLANKDWGNSVDIQSMLYKQYIRPILEYASPAYNSLISNDTRKKLQRIQNQALRAIASLAKTCPIEFLHLETGIEPIQDRLEKIDDIMWDRYARLPEDDSRKKMIQRNQPARLTTRLGWRNKASDRMKEYSIDREITAGPSPPWETFPNIRFEKVPLEKKKSEYSEGELRELTLVKLEEIATPYRIYTDGSTNDKQEKGGAGVFIEDQNGNTLLEASYPAGKMCSSFTGEGVAALKALEWLRDNPGDATICTDSLSLQETLRTNNWKEKDHWINKIKELLRVISNKITVLWLPSHCGIRGNDRADDLAKKGSSMNQTGIPVTHDIMKARIKRRPWKVTHDRAKATYKNRTKPKVEIESRWTRRVRTLYARLRTGHAKELRSYQYKIGISEDPECSCGSKRETIQHLICDCPELEEERRKHFDGKVTQNHLVTHPEECRTILAKKITALETYKNTNEEVDETEQVGSTIPTQ